MDCPSGCSDGSSASSMRARGGCTPRKTLPMIMPPTSSLPSWQKVTPGAGPHFSSISRRILLPRSACQRSAVGVSMAAAARAAICSGAR